MSDRTELKFLQLLEEIRDSLKYIENDVKKNNDEKKRMNESMIEDFKKNFNSMF